MPPCSRVCVRVSRFFGVWRFFRRCEVMPTLYHIVYCTSRTTAEKFDFYSTLSMKVIREKCLQPWFFMLGLLTMTTALMRGVQTSTHGCVRAMTFRMTDKLRSFVLCSLCVRGYLVAVIHSLRAGVLLGVPGVN